MLDAKRGQIFTARFENRDGRPVLRDPAQLGTLREMLGKSGRPVHLLGEGLPYHPLDGVAEAETTGTIVTEPERWAARAQAVADIGFEMARAGRFTDPAALTPIYIRKPEAEEKYEARQAGGR